jgi:hypothetical protein
VNKYLENLARYSPNMAAAMTELSTLPQTFAGWPTNISGEEIDALVFKQKDNFYYIGASAVFAVESETSERPTLATNTSLFEATPGAKQSFYNLYATHVGLYQWAGEELSKKETDPKMKEAEAAQLLMCTEVGKELLAKGRRLIGGYAVLTSVDAPREHYGYVFADLSLVDQYRFATRDATLKGLLPEENPNVVRRRLTLGPDGEVASLAELQIIKMLPTKDQIANFLRVNPETGQAMTRSERRAYEKITKKQKKI